MAHPKRRQSSARQGKRRSHDHAKMPTMAICPGECGHYRGKLAIEKEVAV